MKRLWLLLLVPLLSCEEDPDALLNNGDILEFYQTTFAQVHSDTFDVFSRIDEDGNVELFFPKINGEGLTRTFSRRAAIYHHGYPAFRSKPWKEREDSDMRFGIVEGTLENHDSHVRVGLAVDDTLFLSRLTQLVNMNTRQDEVLEMEFNNPVKPYFTWQNGKSSGGGYLLRVYDREGELIIALKTPLKEFQFYEVFDVETIYTEDYNQPELIEDLRYRVEVFGLDTFNRMEWYDERAFFAKPHGLVDR